jgi:DNA-binding transcriptional ArsR family regulator
MTDHATACYLRQPEHDELAAQMDEFNARGGWIQRLPPGAMNWDALSNKRRSNPVMSILPKNPLAERPPEVKRKREPRPAPAPRVQNGPRIAQPGTQKARILSLLGQGSLRTAEVAQHIGIGRNAACVQLPALREAGLVASTGGKTNMRWAKA